MAASKKPPAGGTAKGAAALIAQQGCDAPTAEQASGGIEVEPCPLTADRQPGPLDHRSCARRWLRHRYIQLHGAPPYGELQRTNAGGISWRPTYSARELHRCIGLVLTPREVSHGS